MDALAATVQRLWNFSDPAASEAQFRAAEATASEPLRSILVTQVARTWGLRKDFDQARAVLSELEPLSILDPEAKAWYWLEWGRTWVSATHPAESRTPEAVDRARKAFLQAVADAEESGQDGVAVDALHMMVFVDTEPAQQLVWNQKTIARAEASADPELRGRWLGPLWNNVGYALHLDGQYDAALDAFAQSKAGYLAREDRASARVADWMTAWTLRVMGRTDEALALQLENERANDEAFTPDFYVFEELETLYRDQGNLEKAQWYGDLKERHRA